MILTQTKYILELLKKTGINGAKPSPLSIIVRKLLSLIEDDVLSNPEPFRSIIRGLQYLIITRPDICFAVNRLSQLFHAPTYSHWERLSRNLKGIVDHRL